MLIMGIAVSAQSLQTSDIADQHQYEALGMSANHRYITGLNAGTYRAFIWDTEAGTIIENDGDYANCDFRAITNDGHAYGILGSEDMVTTNASIIDANGKVSILEHDMSQVFDVTPDGSVAVGCLLDATWLPTAAVWRNGKRILLPIPTPDECGFQHDGANAQYISADGKVIAGYLQDWHSSRPGIVWRLQDDGSYKADVISKGRWELNQGEGKPYLEFSPLGISPNGKWLCLAAQKEGAFNMPGREFMIRMNLETGEVIESGNPVTEMCDQDNDNFYPTAIADDGTCVGVIRTATNMLGIIWRNGTSGPSLLSEEFPTIEQFAGYDEYVGNPVAISADGAYIAGFGCPFTFTAGGLDYNFESYLLYTGKATGIADIKSIKLPSSTYNIQGQAINPSAAKDIYIRNGRKYIGKH